MALVGCIHAIKVSCTGQNYFQIFDIGLPPRFSHRSNKVISVRNCHDFSPLSRAPESCKQANDGSSFVIFRTSLKK